METKEKTGLRPIHIIVIHCSATRENCVYTPEQLDRDHRARGFSEAGYHFYIRRSGDIVIMHQLEMVPAHVKGHNRYSEGICYEGGLNKSAEPTDTRTSEQKRMLKLLIHQLHEKYPTARICGHRDLSPDLNGDGKISSYEWIKTCPCFDVEKEFSNYNQPDEKEDK